MIIKELRFSDFLVFPGEQSIKLPHEKESSLLVILAPNNTGKTTIIRALRFLLYGSVPGTSREDAHKLIHFGATAQAREGTEISAWVEATIEQDGQSRCLRRTVSASRMGAGPLTWRTTGVRLEQVRRARTTTFESDASGVFQRVLKTMVPETLFDAFYFQGEPLDGRLLGEVSDIRASLSSFLHEDKWEEAEQATENLRQKLHREVEAVAEGNKEYQRLLRQQEDAQQAIIKKQNDLEAAEETLRSVKADYVATNEALKSLSPVGEAEELRRKLQDADTHQKKAQKTMEQSDGEVARLVGASNGAPFLLGRLSPARKILKEMEEMNIIPPDLSERFVDQVLAAARCICGREHTPESREHWEDYKRKTLKADISQGLSDLLSAVQETSSRGFIHRSKQLALQIRAVQLSRAQAIQEEQRWSACVKQIFDEFQKLPHAKIRELADKLEKLAEQRGTLAKDIGELGVSLKVLRQRLDQLKREAQQARPLGVAAEKERRLLAARDRANELRELFKKSRQVLRDSFHRILQDSVSAHYLATDESKAHVNYHTLLPAIMVNGQETRNLGGGQSQLLALAYVVALARLRKSLHEQMKVLGIGLGRIDDQSFFLDSPFNQMTDTYAHAIARFLVGSARQTTVLVARHQWEQVREIIEPHADHIYALELHTTPDVIANLRAENKEKDFVYQTVGKKISLLKELPDANTLPYTKILHTL